MQVERDQGDGLAQAHVVGEARTQPQRGEVGQPGQPVPLVVAQGRHQSGGLRDRLTRRRLQHPLAHPQQRGADVDLVVDLLHLHGAGQRGGQRLGGLHRAHQSLAGLARQRRVDDGPAAAQLQDRLRGGGQPVHLLLGERLTVHRQLPVEAEQRVGAEQPVVQGLLARSVRRGTPVEHRRSGQVAAQAPRPHHVDPALGQRPDAVLEQADQLVGVEGDLVGHPQPEQPVEDRPGVGRRAQRDARVGAGPGPEPVVGAGEQVDRVAHVQRVALVVDLQHEAYGARDQLLLVGLDPQRDPHQLRQVLVAHPLVAGQLLLQPRREVHRPVANFATGHRGGARHRVGDGVEDQQDQGLGRLRVVLAPRGREQPHPVGVVGVQRRHPPAPPGRVVGMELAARHQPQPEQRRSGQQPDRRVQVVARVRLGEHRQRRTDRQRDGAPLVAELHHALARRIGGPEGRRTGDGHEAQAADLGAGGAGLRT